MNICAIDIGGTFTKLGLVDESGLVSGFARLPTTPPAHTFLTELLTHVDDLLTASTAVAGIGVSVAGFIDAAHSRMTYNPNLPWLQGFPLRNALADTFGLPVMVEVDSNAAALGEFRFGEGAGSKRFLFLTVGTGIGGGLIVDGEVVRFAEQCIGDVGHVIVAPGGRLCSCGGRGCAEAVAAGPRIVEDGLFAEAGGYLGLLAASLGAVFFPDRIALGGGICEASQLVMDAARAAFESSAGNLVRESATIRQARLGARASLIGAACPFLSPRSPEASVM